MDESWMFYTASTNAQANAYGIRIGKHIKSFESGIVDRVFLLSDKMIPESMVVVGRVTRLDLFQKL